MAEKQCNLVKNGGGMSKYSTSEVFTGEYWIDGKPIYRKTYSGIVCTTGEYNYITSEYIDTPINITGYLEFSGGTKYTIGAVTVSAVEYSATVFLRQPPTGPATINCQKGASAESYTATVTIYYTKQ